MLAPGRREGSRQVERHRIPVEPLVERGILGEVLKRGYLASGTVDHRAAYGR
jgi:hypothetical protein